MSLSNSSQTELGFAIATLAPAGTAMSADAMARRCTNKIVHVGPEVPEEMRKQAEKYKNQVFETVKAYIIQAKEHERATAVDELRAAGHHDAAKDLEGK